MEKASSGWWSRNLWKIVILPVLAGAILTVVTLVLTRFVPKWFFDEPPPRPRPTVSTADAYQRIATDLERRDPEVRPKLRYLSLLHRHNEPSCTAAEIETDRRALRELVAILWPNKSARSDFIDPEQLIFRIDLDDFNWDAATDWHAVVSHYRYGLGAAGDDPTANLRRQVEKLTQDRIPVVRSDWFVVAISQSPLAGPNGIVRTLPKDLPESVRTVRSLYAAQSLDLAACARELGLDDTQGLTDLIRRQEILQQEFGLAPLLQNGRIRREWWESERNLVSPYQEVARQLKIGNPVCVQ